VRCEFVDVRVAGVPLGPTGGDERVHEVSDDFADVCGEPSALLGGGLVAAEGAADLPLDLLCGGERVGGAEHLGAVPGERDVDGGGILAVDGGEPVGVKTPPQPVVGTLQPLLCCVELCGERGVLAEQRVEFCRELPRAVWDRATYDVVAFRGVPVAACERERPVRFRLAGRGRSRSR
jgi:hypothetical protein